MQPSRLYLVGPRRVRPHARSRPEQGPYDLALQPQRPGELGRETVVSPTPEHATEIERRASVAGLPTALWSTLAVEATRSISLVAAVLGIPPLVAETALSSAARKAEPPQRRSRLNDYASALRAAVARDPCPFIGGVALRPGLASVTAWEAEAAAAEMPLEAWILRAIAAAPDGFVAWEAAAADRGYSLPEWALVQAARRSRSASTPAQIPGWRRPSRRD